MNTILFMTMTVNGFVADEKGSEEFLSDANWHVFSELVNRVSSNIWGRTTYEKVKMWEKKYLGEISGVKKVIVSHDSSLVLDPDFFLATSLQHALSLLEKDGRKETIVSGGPTLNKAFMEEGLIDEIVLSIEPILLGRGVPLFPELLGEIQLELLECKQFDSNHLLLRYKVKK